MRRLATLAVALVGFTLWGSSSAAPAFADCPQNSDRGIWVESTQSTMSHGDQLSSKILEQNPGDCTFNNAIIAESTAYEALGPRPLDADWVEMGWVEMESAFGVVYNIFTEWGTQGKINSCGGLSCIFSSGCAVANGTISLRVNINSTANNTWNMAYACNGGGYTTRSTSASMPYDYGVPMGEISHHSTVSATFTTHITNTIFRNQNNVWSQTWGNIDCANGLTTDNVIANGFNARDGGSNTSYDTGKYPTGLCE